MTDSGQSMLEQALADLTCPQQDCVDWGNGPLLVLAGPGSGKTRVLTTRIARIVAATPEKPFRILALTFTTKAADEVRQRISRLVPGGADRLFVGTFHSFCAEVLRLHGGHLGISPDFCICSTHADREVVIKAAVREAMDVCPNVLASDTRYLRTIDELRARMVAPENVSTYVRNPQLSARISVVYEAYNQQMRRDNVLDFPALIYYACMLFQTYPAFARRYRTVYTHWCIDEFQDTNSCQYALISAMAAGEFRNLFVVADDDQIIYEWNGASHERLDQLKSDFGPEVIQLPTNHRCPYEVVALANRLIAHNQLRTPDKKPLSAVKSPAPPGSEIVRLTCLDSDLREAEWVVADIAERHADHLGAVAVLARNRRLLGLAKNCFDEAGVHAVIAQRRDEFSSAPFVWLHACLQQCNDRGARRNLEALCGSFEQLTGIHTDVSMLIANADATDGDYLREWVAEVLAAPAPEAAGFAASKVGELLVLASDVHAFVPFAVQWLDSCVSARAHSAQEEPFSGYEDDRSAWAQLYPAVSASVGGHSTLGAFLHELAMRSKEPPVDSSAVPLMTVHGAKGKEFDHVYLMGLADEEFPSYQSTQMGDQSCQMEEERRNCFVAITRTRETLALSYAESYRGWPKEPSRFLAEMGLLVP